MPLWLLLFFNFNAEGNTLRRSYDDYRYVDDIDDRYNDYYVDDDYVDYYDDYYHGHDGYDYYLDGYESYNEYTEDMLLDDILENMDSDYLSLVDDDLWDDDDYWEGFYAGLMTENAYNLDDFENRGMFNWLRSKMQKDIHPFVHGAATMIRAAKQKEMSVVSKKVVHATSWMGPVAGPFVAKQVNKLLNAKADKLCDSITSKWKGIMSRALGVPKRKLAKPKPKPHLSWWQRQKAAAAKKLKELEAAGIKFAKQQAWNHAIGWANGEYVRIMKGYKEEMHQYLETGIEAIVSTFDGQIDSKLSMAPEAWRADWKKKLRGFIEDKFGELGQAMIDAAMEKAKWVFNKLKEALLKYEGLDYDPRKDDVAARMAAGNRLLDYNNAY